MSLRKKLTLSMLMIAVIPVMVLGGFYYQYFSGVLLSNVQQRELQNNSQIIYSVDNFFNSIFKISDSLLMNEELMDILQKSYEEQSSPLEGYRDKAQVDKLLYKDGYYLDGRIETIAIFPGNNSMFYYCTKEDINPSYDIHAEEWYEKIASKEGAKVLVGVHQNRLVYAFSDAARPYCVTVGRSIYSPYDSQLLGTMLININVHDLQTCWPAFKEDSQERFYLLDDENNVVFSNLTEEIGGKFFQDGLEDGISSCRIDGKLYDTIVSGSKSLGWKSVKMIPRSQLDQEIAVVPYMTLLLMLILTVLAVLVSIFISKISTRPLQELYVKLQSFEAEKSGIPLPENQVEIKGLARSYQHMINEINALTIKNYETQIQLRRAELMALQSQINPHFIYNAQFHQVDGGYARIQAYGNGVGFPDQAHAVFLQKQPGGHPDSGRDRSDPGLHQPDQPQIFRQDLC